ncbi:MAG TPA: exodeoxyribonuclease VII large subunit [Chitinophagaceae bacterium]|nr:exodeoxyribonuclease VII large subunit [Chitinophagaceae bacterium]
MEQTTFYTPAAILQIFNNAITVKETRQLVQLKGIYTPGRGANYSGMFYDSLKDETTDAQLTIIVPALLREKLQPRTTIECTGFLLRRVTPNASKIDIQLQVTEIIGSTANAFSEEDLKAIRLQQIKANDGYRDVTGFLKSKLARGEFAHIAVLVGRNSIIEHDIRHALKDAIGFYDIVFEQINLSSEFDITRAFEGQVDMDIIVLARGGGDNLDIFNRSTLAEAALRMEPYFVTAIGHEQDTPLLQKIADKAFITPTAFGQYLYDLYNETTEQTALSKTKLIEDITKQVSVNYEQQLQQTNLLLEQARQMAKEKARPNVWLIVLVLVLGLLAGAILAYLLLK